MPKGETSRPSTKAEREAFSKLGEGDRYERGYLQGISRSKEIWRKAGGNDAETSLKKTRRDAESAIRKSGQAKKLFNKLGDPLDQRMMKESYPQKQRSSTDDIPAYKKGGIVKGKGRKRII